MLLKPGRTAEEAIKFFDDMQWGGLNDCRNDMPAPTDVTFPSGMLNAIRKYTRWTDAAMRQIREVVDDPAVPARLRSETYWVLIGADVISLSDDINDAIQQAVDGLRGAGYSWAEIGSRLDVTRQAAQQRWGRAS